MFGVQSPVETHSDTVYLDIHLPASARLEVPADARELAAYPVRGQVRIGGQPAAPGTMAVGHVGQRLTLETDDASAARVFIIGGTPLDSPREIWWNFASSSKDRIEQAKADWAGGRFPKVPGDIEEIPLPTS